MISSQGSYHFIIRADIVGSQVGKRAVDEDKRSAVLNTNESRKLSNFSLLRPITSLTNLVWPFYHLACFWIRPPLRPPCQVAGPVVHCKSPNPKVYQCDSH
jgi:hypothetical protein